LKRRCWAWRTCRMVVAPRAGAWI